MPCPFFEPVSVAQPATHRFGLGRLPLIEEFEGVCHLSGTKQPVVDAALRRSGCNSGHAGSACADWNAHLQLRSEQRLPVLRFSVVERRPALLRVTVVEEGDYAPLRWKNVTFSPELQTLDPDFADTCQRAQVLAFCRSYLQRFPSDGPE